MNSLDDSIYRGARVLITGGLGFIGSNIAHRLVAVGAKVTILDALLPQHGGNPRNLRGIQDKVNVVIDDIRNADTVKRVVADKDYVFNLAGQVSYTDSMNDPFRDLDISCLGHLTLLDACRRVNPPARIVFSSSRMVYDRQVTVPVAEDARTGPLTFYGVHKLTGEYYHRLHSMVYEVPTAIVRIANPYGPRQRIQGGKYGIVNWFLTLAMRNDTLKIFGDGQQLRDYIYIDDLVTAILRIGLLPNMTGQVYNVGSGRGSSFRDMVHAVVRAAGSGSFEYVEWPSNYSSFETGDFVADVRRLQEDTGFTPSTSLDDGLSRTVEFCRQDEAAST